MSCLSLKIFNLPPVLCVLLAMIGTSAFAQPTEVSEVEESILITHTEGHLSPSDLEQSIFSSVETIDLEEEIETISENQDRSFKKRQWYGYKILLAELGNVIFPGIVYLVSGPLVHVFEKKYMTGLYSFLLRLFTPIAGAGLSYSLCQSCQNDGLSRLGSLAVGAFFGGLTAIVIDTSVFAYKDVSVSGSPLAITSRLNGIRAVELGALPQPWVLKWVIKF